MTASEAREAATECREDARRMDGYVTEGPWKDRSARMRLAAVALDAYADGIDGGEWTPIGTSFEFRPTSADTNRLHRIRARLLDLVPLDGTMSLADDVHRLDRALADAEARGRQHGLLVAAWLASAESEWTTALRDQHAGSPDRDWWDASALSANVVRSAIVFLGHDTEEATDGR